MSKPREKFIGGKLQQYTENWYKDVMDQLVKRLDEYVKNGSAWIVEGIEKVTLVVTTYRQLNPQKDHRNVTLSKKFTEYFNYSVRVAIYWHKIHQEKV